MVDTPFATTLRLDADLARYLQDAAKRADLSVNGFLAELLRARREAERRARLAADWAAYAQDAEAQGVEYAFIAQAEPAAEPRRSYRARKPAPPPKASKSPAKARKAQ